MGAVPAMLTVLDHREGNCKSAGAHFDKAAALIDMHIEALHAQATCLMPLQQMDDAVRAFRVTQGLGGQASIASTT